MTEHPGLYPEIVGDTVEAVGSGESVCLLGAIGSGKSTLLRSVAEAIPGSRPVSWVRGFGTLRSVSGAGLPELDPASAVVFLDDADELDEVSALRLRQFGESTRTPIVFTSSSLRRLPEALAELVSTGRARTIDIPMLDLTGARRIAVDMLGDKVETATVSRALDWAAGAPLGVIRYIELAESAGVIHRRGGFVAIDRRFEPEAQAFTPDLAQRHRFRLPADDDAGEHLLGLIACARLLPVAILADVIAWQGADPAAWRRVARDLIDRGIVREERTPSGPVLRFASSRTGWEIRRDADELGRVTLVRALREQFSEPESWPPLAQVAVVAEAARCGLPVSRAELARALEVFARIAGAEIDEWSRVGRTLLGALPTDIATDPDFGAGQDLADVAVAIHKGVDIGLLLDLLRPAARRGDVDCAFAAAFLLQDGRGDVPAAVALLEEAVARHEASGDTVGVARLAAGQWALRCRAGETDGPAPEIPSGPDATGDPDAIADSEAPGAASFLSTEVAVMSALAELWNGNVESMLMSLAPLVVIEPGGCRDIACQGEVFPVMAFGLLHAGYRPPDDQEYYAWLPHQQANVHLGAGLYLLERGAADSALDAFEQGIAATVPGADSAVLVHLELLAAAAAGRAGRTSVAAAHLAEVDADTSGARRALDGVLGAESARLRLMAVAADPDALRAEIPRALAAGEAAEAAGRTLVATQILWELWRLGVDVDTGRWLSLAERVDGDRGRAHAALVRAWISQDPAELAKVSEEFERLDMLAAAAEAVSTAAVIHLERGERKSAEALVVRSTELTADLGSFVLPRISLRSPDDPRLTNREREIATLVAAGESNARIAERLFVSIRTVDSHLYRIFAKLGITHRGQLRPTGGIVPRSTGSISAPFGERE